MKISIKLLSLLLFCVIIFGTMAVQATWVYGLPVESVFENLLISMAEFDYKPEEVLPGTEEDSKFEINHQSLLEEILNNSKYGVNKSSVIPSNLPDYNDILHGYENKIGGGNMNNIPNAGNLGFTITCVRENDEIVAYYLYTFDEFSSYTAGKGLKVYRTLIEKNENTGKWEGVSSKEGYVIAESTTVKLGKDYYYILPFAWQSGSMPTT